MTDIVFWALLSLLDWDKTGDDAAVIEPVAVALSERSIEEILEFEEILAQKLYTLDTNAHAEQIGEEAYVDENNYFSVDGFLYARCVVVANGKSLYESVVSDPKSFPKDLEFETLLRIGAIAYERKTGKEYNHITKVSYETYSNKEGWH